jgi:signal transduction histidine kinase
MEELVSYFSVVYFLAIAVLLVAFIVILFAVKSRNQISLELQKREIEFQKELNNIQLRSIEEEQRKIGAILHDDLGQILTLIWIQIHTLKQGCEARNFCENDFRRIEKYSQLSKEKCSSISRMLYPAVLMRLGFNSGLEELVSDIHKSTGILIDLNCEEMNLNEIVANNLYRILQELLNNSVKHSKATQIKIGIAKNGHFVNIVYTDNGVGFNNNEVKQGLGLTTIFNRINVLDGILIEPSTISVGYNLSFKIPYEKD